MLTVAVFVGLLAFASAHGSNNMMGQNPLMQLLLGGGGNAGYGRNTGMGGQMGGNWGMGGNMQGMGGNWGMGGSMQGMGGNWGMGGRTQGMGGNMQGNMQGMGGNMQGMGGRGGQQQQGVMGGVMLLLLRNLLEDRNGRDNRMSGEEMEAVEEMMKKKMMMEMTEMIMMQMAFKEKEKEFEEAMGHLCFMVNATYYAYKKNGTEVFTQTTEESMKQMGEELEGKSKEEKMDYAANMMMKNPDKYAEVFMRFSTWACMAGDAFAKAYEKMEKMEKGDSDDH